MKKNVSELTPQSAYQLLLNGKIDSVRINICSSDSSVEIQGNGQLIVDRSGLSFNSTLVVGYRFEFQKNR